jgi:hypothetical protein
MKHLFSLCLFMSFLFLFTCSYAQEVKMKSKAHKTKVKTEPGTTNTQASSTAAAPNNTVSLANTSWMTFFADPINDTIINHYAVDSSFVRSKTTGETMVNSVYKLDGDTLTFYDLGGVHACPSNMIGIYRIAITGDVLKLDPISDDCDGRADAIKNVSWQRFEEPNGR